MEHDCSGISTSSHWLRLWKQEKSQLHHSTRPFHQQHTMIKRSPGDIMMILTVMTVLFSGKAVMGMLLLYVTLYALLYYDCDSTWCSQGSAVFTSTIRPQSVLRLRAGHLCAS